MPIWTLQSKKVVNIAKNTGVFYPDFSFSPRQHQKDYQRILSAFNSLNGTDCKGVIFCLAPELFANGENEYKNVDEVKKMFQGNQAITNSFANSPYNLFDKEHLLLKIDERFYNEVHVIPIDYWNHILVMDGGSPEIFDFQKMNSDYADLDYKTFEMLIFESIQKNRYVRPIMPTRYDAPYNTMTEIHIPNISYDAILETYEASELVA